MKNNRQDVTKVLHECMEIRIKSRLLTTPEQYYNLTGSVRGGCYELLHSPVKKICGYIIWANINEECAFRFEQQSIGPIYPYEWKEGNIMLVMDVVTEPRYRFDSLSKIRKFIRDNRTNLLKVRGKYFSYLKVSEK